MRSLSPPRAIVVVASIVAAGRARVVIAVPMGLQVLATWFTLSSAHGTAVTGAAAAGLAAEAAAVAAAAAGTAEVGGMVEVQQELDGRCVARMDRLPSVAVPIAAC